MSDQPLVSIVLPTYNGSRYLQQAIDSICKQTYSNWELIIVDDASTDETPRIVSAFRDQDPRIRAFRNEINRKLPASLNKGFAEAQGDLLTWTSDDNLYLPTALHEMAEILRYYSSFDIVYCDYDRIDSVGAVMGRALRPPIENLIHNNWVGACFLFRRQVHDVLRGYREDLFLVEDYDFWLRAFLQGYKFHHYARVLYQFREHPASLTTQRTDAIRGRRRALQAALLPAVAKQSRRQVVDFLLRAAGEGESLKLPNVVASCWWAVIRIAPQWLWKKGVVHLLFRASAQATREQVRKRMLRR